MSYGYFHVDFDDTWRRRPWYLKLCRVIRGFDGWLIYLPGLRIVTRYRKY